MLNCVTALTCGSIIDCRYGDMGHSHYNNMKNMMEECKAGTIDAIIHMGDHCYNLGMDNGIAIAIHHRIAHNIANLCITTIPNASTDHRVAISRARTLALLTRLRDHSGPR
jgi:hypothetical protein